MAKIKKQILYIHGGMTFKNRADYLKFLKTRKIKTNWQSSWSDDYLNKKLEKHFQIIRPRMPLNENAKYEDWKIHFERYLPFLKNNLILIGNSLGGTFLAKYLSENKFPKKLKAVFLVCPPFDNSLPGEDLVGGFSLKIDLSLLNNSTKNLFLLFSKKDDVVPPIHAEKFKKKLNKANIIVYNNIKGHFRISSFPELIKIIKKISKY